jgi:hypothetical protein
MEPIEIATLVIASAALIVAVIALVRVLRRG